MLRDGFATCAWLAVAVAVGACTEPPTSATTGTGGGVSSAQGGGGAAPFLPSGFSCSGNVVHYHTDVAPIFDQHCGGVEGCHVTMHMPQGAYELLVNQEADECPVPRLKVAPGDPEHSYAINKMTNTNLCDDTSPMPKVIGRPWTELPPTFIQPVYDWICQGAKND